MTVYKAFNRITVMKLQLSSSFLASGAGALSPRLPADETLSSAACTVFKNSTYIVILNARLGSGAGLLGSCERSVVRASGPGLALYRLH